MTAATDTEVRDRKLDTIRKLLAKAENAGTPEEAETYRNKATELMMAYSIDEAMLAEKSDQADTIGNLRIVFTGGYAKAQMGMANRVATAFGAKLVYTAYRGEVVVHIWGWNSDLPVIETLIASLLIQGAREAKVRWHQIYTAGAHGLNGKSFTTSFWVGFGNEVGARLTKQRKHIVDDTPGAALVLYDRDKLVEQEYRRRNPELRLGSGSQISSRLGYYGGQDAGRNADIGNTRVGGRTAIGPATR